MDSGSVPQMTSAAGTRMLVGGDARVELPGGGPEHRDLDTGLALGETFSTAVTVPWVTEVYKVSWVPRWRPMTGRPAGS